jgi:hypothetical protein
VIEDSDDLRALHRRVPHGVVFVIAPWNYPYLTAINTVVPALMAGNAVVLKHATQTLLVGERAGPGLPRPGCRRTCSRTCSRPRGHRGTDLGRALSTSSTSPARSAAAAIERAAAGTFTGSAWSSAARIRAM